MTIPIKMRRTAIFGTLMALSFTTRAQQKIDTAHLLGSWVLERYVFIVPDEDSTMLRNEGLGHIITFERGNKFVTKKRVGSSTKLVDSGTYDLDIENRTISQNDQECKIVELTNQRLILRLEDGVELHFKKLLKP